MSRFSTLFLRITFLVITFLRLRLLIHGSPFLVHHHILFLLPRFRSPIILIFSCQLVQFPLLYRMLSRCPSPPMSPPIPLSWISLSPQFPPRFLTVSRVGGVWDRRHDLHDLHDLHALSAPGRVTREDSYASHVKIEGGSFAACFRE